MSTLNDSIRIAFENAEKGLVLISSLNNKLLLLESIRTWIPITISILAVLVTIGIFVVNGRNNKRNLLRSLLKEFKAAQRSSEEIGAKMAPLIGKKAAKTIQACEITELDILNRTLESRNDNVLNELETSCKAFYQNETMRKEFINELFEDVQRFVDNNKSKYTPPFTSFPNTLRFYEQICKRRM
jgi:hypothetical protein